MSYAHVKHILPKGLYPCRMPPSQKGRATEEQKAVDFKTRIRSAMTAKGWTPSPAELMAHWKAKHGEALTPTRQAFYVWLKQETAKITPENLFLLADLLDVNARWLVFYESDDHDRMSKPIFPDPEMNRLLDAYRALGEAGREVLIEEAGKLLRVQGPSPASPYATKK